MVDSLDLLGDCSENEGRILNGGICFYLARWILTSFHFVCICL